MTTSELDPLKALETADLESPGEAVSARILEECTQGLEPATGLSQRARLALSGGALALGIVGIALTRSLSTTESHPFAAAGLYGAAGWGFMLTILLVLGLGGPPGSSTRRQKALLMALGTLLAFFAYLALGADGFGGLWAALGAPGTLSCATHTLITGGLVAGVAMLLWRGTDPFSPKLSGALLGLLGGLSGALGVGIICPSGDGWHLWLGHGLGVLVLIGLCGTAGRRWLAP